MKRQFSIIACLALVIAMVLSFASCDLVNKVLGKTEQPEHTHSFVEGKCECGESDPNYVPPHTHNFVDGKCECGEEDPNYVPECTEHANSIEVTKEATCTEAGEKKLTCTLCGHVETLEIAPLGHTEEKVPGKKPTCTETGLSDGKKCSVCGVELVAQRDINATGHTFVEGKCECGEIDPNYNGPKTYVLDIQSMASVAQKEKADGESAVFADFFTIYYSAKFKLDGSNKTFGDGFEASQRLNWGGGTVIGDTTKNAIMFTVDGTATVKVWWVCGGTYDIKEGDIVIETLPRQVGIYDAEGNLVASTNIDENSVPEGDTDGIKNNLFISELAVSKAGTYYLGNVGNSNYFFNVEVVVTPADEEPKNEIKVETTDTYTMYNHDYFTFTADGEGYYTFTVPAGLGILADGANAPEIDYYDNDNGGEFTIGLEAGQEIIFWISAMTKDTWTLEWTFEAAEVEPYAPAGCDHWWMPAMGHPDMVLPTCQEGGVIVSECWLCSEIKTEEVGPDTVDGHYYVLDESTYVETTCQVDGYKKETCSLCNDVKETTFDHTIYGEHNYVADEATYKEANCMEAGYAKYTCSVCDHSYEETTEADPAWGHQDVSSSSYSIMVCEVCNRVKIGVYVDPTETSFGIQFGMNYGSGAIFFAAFNADNSVFEMYGYTATLVDGVYTITLDNNNNYETSAFGLLNATITVKPACGGVDVIITPAEGEAVTIKNYEGDGVHAYTYPCDKICSVCYEETNLDATHTIVHVEAKDSTCSVNGNVEYWYCSACGYAWADEALTLVTNQMSVVLPTLDHDYVDGICSACQAKDPAYVDYYLVGYINGADYGCQDDYANLGEYKFVDGKLTVTFNDDSYVFVKTGNLNGENVKWYLFEDYHGDDKTEGTLIEGKSEKMFIPGNVEVIFTLTVNEDGTLTLSYHIHSYEAVVTDPTCTNKGYTTHTCSCGASYTDSEVAALDHADNDGDYKCDACSAKVLPADGTALTIPQALAIAKLAGTAYTTQKYYITGIVTNVYNTQYGNLYLKDAEGNQICIYGLYTWDKAIRYDKMDYKPVEGDELTVYTVLGMYNTTCQGVDAWVDEVVAHEHDYKAVVTDPTCTKGGYTTNTCSICNGYYVDAETEALGHTTENGECERCGQTIGGDVVNNETLTADFSSLSKNTTYGTYTTTDKLWSGKNCQILQGGTADNSNSGTYVAIGGAAARAYVLNGKTSAKGVLTSATISGGISKLELNYANFYSEGNGVDFTITIKDANGNAVATKKVDVNSITKNSAYTLSWDLAEEGVAVSGDFTIEITNNSPSNSTSNKDRVAIWNIAWTTNY